MRILVTGASGFIGKAVCHALTNKYSVIPGSRKPIDGYTNWVCIDFDKKNDWHAILENTDCVINAIGIMEGNLEKVQTTGSIDLFAACISKNIRVINISAVGAEREIPVNSFLATKKKADDFLLRYPHGRVIYPGIVLGTDAKSTRFFAEIASLPLVVVPKNQQPPLVHIRQLTDVILNVLQNFESAPQRVYAVSAAEPFENVFTVLRGKKPLFIPIPLSWMRFIFFLFPKLQIGIFNHSMLSMLSSIRAADYPACCKEASPLLYRSPVQRSDHLLQLASLLSVAFIWIWSGVSSLSQWGQSEILMQEAGFRGFWIPFLIYAGSIADLLVGVMVMLSKWRRTVLITQFILLITYMLILSFYCPVYWMHPYGVLAKNIPLMALMGWTYANTTGRV